MPDDGLNLALTLELRELLYAERIMTRLLARSSRASRDRALKNLLSCHWRESEGNTERVRESLKRLGSPVRAKKCSGMSGIEAESFKAAESGFPGPLRDSLLILNARKARHYEIATYETLIAWSEQISAGPVTEYLSESLVIIQDLKEKLAPLARRVNADVDTGAGARDLMNAQSPVSVAHRDPGATRED